MSPNSRYSSNRSTVGLSRLQTAAKQVSCPSCQKTGKTATGTLDKKNTSKRLQNGLFVTSIAPILLFFGCPCCIPCMVQETLGATVTHYCGHCGLRLAQYDGKNDINHVFVRGYFAAITRSDVSTTAPTPSPLGPPVKANVPGIHRPFDNYVNSTPVRILSLGKVSPPYPSVLVMENDAAKSPLFTVTVNDGKELMAFDPCGKEPAWDMAKPHARILRHHEASPPLEVARLRFFVTNREGFMYFPGVNGRYQSGRVEYVDGFGYDCDSSFGPIVWVYRSVAEHSSTAGAKPELRWVLLDAYDQLVAMESAEPRQLWLYGEFEGLFLEELISSYVVTCIQDQRFSEQYWTAIAQYA